MLTHMLQLLAGNVVMYADMPSTTVISQFQSYPPYRASGYPTMCELTLQDVIDNGCTRWGPRYSRGLLLDDVAQAHSCPGNQSDQLDA